MTDPIDTAALVALARALLADDCRTDATIAGDAVTLARGVLVLVERERRLVEALRGLLRALAEGGYTEAAAKEQESDNPWEELGEPHTARRAAEAVLRELGY